MPAFKTVTETNVKQLKNYDLRARIPKYLGLAAASLVGLSVIAVVLLFFRAKQQPEFRMRGFPTELSKDLVADVSGYERTEYDAGKKKYYIKADRARTFADNHQELETVFIEVFDQQADGQSDGQSIGRSDKITAEKAVYIPQENKNFTAYLAGSVKIISRDELVIDGEQVTYTKSDDTAVIDEPLKFHRFNVAGRADRAKAFISAKIVELTGNVEVFQYPDNDLTGEPKTRLNSGFAAYNQEDEKIKLGDGVRVVANGNGDASTTLESSAAEIRFRVAEQNREFIFAEARENVKIASFSPDRSQTLINSSYGSFDKIADRFDLRGGIRILTADEKQPTEISADSAVYDQKNLHAEILGRATITQPTAVVRGDKILANFSPERRLKDAEVLGNAYAAQSEPERTIEISAAELNVAYSSKYLLSGAGARTNASVVLTPKSGSSDYSRASMQAVRKIDVFFRADGASERMITDGRTTLQMDAIPGTPDSANRKLIADVVRAYFSTDGKNLSRAEAEGNAELIVEPVTKSTENYQTKVSAPRFVCLFYAIGNNARQCDAGGPTKTVRTPLVPAEGRGEQTLTAGALSASFTEATRDLDRLEATGGTRFTELDRNGTANRILFTNNDGIVRLRDGEPTVWDSRARAKAAEIDWDTRLGRSYLRANVAATYYSPERAAGSVPFAASGKPVFVTSEIAEIDHRAEIATFSGNARAWQEKNYVRGNRLTINQNEGRFEADGDVQSVLYDVKRNENGKTSGVPVSAAASKMIFIRRENLLRYIDNVDVRQGSDRITAKRADIYLNERNEIERSEFSDSVTITQPGRRASADYALYNAEREIVILRGRPARVTDATQGSSEGGEIQMDLRANRVVNEGRSGDNSGGRTRSVYKLKVN